MGRARGPRLPAGHRIPHIPPMDTSTLTLELPPAPASPLTPTIELNDRDLALVYQVAVYKYLLSTQIKRQYWPFAAHQTAAKRLSQLVRAGFLRRRFIDSRATDEAHSSRLAVYDWPGPCQTRLKQHFIAQRDAERWQSYAAVIKAHAHERMVSSGFLRHETAISEFFLCLEEAAARQGWRLWWMRTSSPRTKGVSAWVKLDTDDLDSEAVHFSPDALFVLADPAQQFRAGTFEYESRDKRKAKRAYRRRLRGHQAVAEQNIFADILSQFIATAQIPLHTDPSRVGMHVLTVAGDSSLRDDLFLACASLRSPAVRFAFASLTDVTPDTALSPIWLRTDLLASTVPDQQRLLDGGTPITDQKLDRRYVGALPRASLCD
jgi:hypothetical protein